MLNCQEHDAIVYLVVELLHLQELDQGGLAEVGQQDGLGVVRQAEPLGVLEKDEKQVEKHLKSETDRFQE